jgi:NAD(P)-dependent dehydrogenase (short-subunit alcohol dehydrogenase family)
LTSPPHTLVVGGTRGVGRAFVARAAAAGDVVSVVGRTKVDDADGSSIRHFDVDITNREALEGALTRIAARGPLSSAAFFQRYRGTGDAWEGEMATTLTAVRRVIEWMALPPNHTENASIVAVGSSAAQFIASEQPAGYHVAKAALVHLVRFYAVALGASKIRLNAISSGTIVKAESRKFYDAHPELDALYREVVPLGRMCTADDIVDVAMFLLSKQASYITGQNIVVDGGISLVWQESLARRLTPLKNLTVVSDRSGSE